MPTLPGWIALLIVVAAMLSMPLKSAIAGVGAAAGAAQPSKRGDAALGQRLFLGRVPLDASLRGEAGALPSRASRCINCHGVPGAAPAAPRGVAQMRETALPLAAFASRRGGPPFAYDATSLCRTLRTGIDPQQVWLARAMPLFRLTPPQCAALWAYLTESPKP